MKKLVVVLGIFMIAGVSMIFNVGDAAGKVYGNAGNGGSASVTNKTNCSTQTVGSCNGGGWTYHHTNSNSVTIGGMSGSGYSFPGGTITGCKKVGGYWVSSWFRNGDPNDLVGIAQNNQWNSKGTSGRQYDFTYDGERYKDTAKGFNGYNTYNTKAARLGEVYQDFLIAQELGVVKKNVKWGTVGWFCASGDWEDEDEVVGKIYGTSQVTASDGTMMTWDSGESSANGNVTLEVSTEEERVALAFTHKFYFTHLKGRAFKASDPKIEEDFIYSGKDSDKNNNKKYTIKEDGLWKIKPVNAISKKNGVEVASDTVWVDVVPNKTITICRILWDYLPKFGVDADGDEYYAGTEKSTKACAKVTGKKDPGPEPEPEVELDNSEKLMFAGEESKVKWNTSAKGSSTSRLAEFKAVAFLVDPSVTRSSNTIEGSNRTNLDPCGLASDRLQNKLTDCRVASVDSGVTAYETWNTASDTSGGSHSFTHTQSIVVPELYNNSTSAVGAKYCITSGYRFEGWEWYTHTWKCNCSTSESGVTTCQTCSTSYWRRKTSEDHWEIDDMKCVPIAKKPTMAVYNGSVFVGNGTIRTSLAKRYDNTAMMTIKSNGGERTLFGSWAEYILAGNGGIISGSYGKGMTSAAAVAVGQRSKLVVKSGTDGNSNMTIANSESELGYAGIVPSTSYEKDYLTRYINGVGTNATTLAGLTNADTGHIYSGEGKSDIRSYEGNLTITGDIINDTSIAHSNIKNLPQNVIFVAGNLDIASNVTQIDAWLIVDGTLNTCVSFKNKKTGAASSDDCSKQLTFNGPVWANNLKLNRTYGAQKDNNTQAGDEREAPAEIFNMRPDAYIWAYQQSTLTNETSGTRYDEAYSRELAPRY